MIAAMAYIRDDSMDKDFVECWNNANKKIRHALLSKAGRNPHHKHKSWVFVPHDIRIDLVTVMKHEKLIVPAQSTPASKTATAYWWNKD